MSSPTATPNLSEPTADTPSAAGWGTVSPIEPAKRRRKLRDRSATRETYDPTSAGDVAGYGQDKFYVASTNGHDHSEQVRVKVPPGVAAAMGAAIESWPIYSSRNDFVRDAIVHRLHWLNEQSAIPEIREYLLFETSERLFNDRKLRTQRFQKMLDEAAEALIAAREAQDQFEIANLVEHLDTLADDLDAPWGDRIRDLTSRYIGK